MLAYILLLGIFYVVVFHTFYLIQWSEYSLLWNDKHVPPFQAQNKPYIIDIKVSYKV